MSEAAAWSWRSESTIPDGTVLELDVVEPMTEDELAELDAALAQSQAEADAGQVISAEDFLRELRAAP